MKDLRSYVLNLIISWENAFCKLKLERAWREVEHAAIPVQCSYQLSYMYQANWELVTLWVCNIPVDAEDVKWIYDSS